MELVPDDGETVPEQEVSLAAVVADARRRKLERVDDDVAVFVDGRRSEL
jgi:hypothetical protein